MRTIKGYVSTGSKKEFTFEVEDDATVEKIEEAFKEEMWILTGRKLNNETIRIQ